MVATGCLRGRPRPRLGGGEAGSTRQAFPFSAAENLLDGAMKKKEKQGGMNRKGTRRSILMAGDGQPTAPTITSNYDPLCMQGLVQSVQLPRHHGEVETRTSNQPTRSAQGRRLLGPAVLRSCPFASLHGQVRARLGPGGYCQHSGNGGPQTCLAAAWLKGGPSTAHLHQHRHKTLTRGQASRGGRRGASSGAASSGWLTRRRSEEHTSELQSRE